MTKRLYTEDDTFLALRKVTPDVLFAIIDSITNADWYSMTDDEIDKLFIRYGWTYHEWVILNAKRQQTC